MNIKTKPVFKLNKGQYFYNPDLHPQDIYQFVELVTDEDGNILDAVVDCIGWSREGVIDGLYRTLHRTAYNIYAEVVIIELAIRLI